MQVFREGTNSLEHSFLFDADISGSLILVKQNIRSEASYSSDFDQVKTALGYLKKIKGSFGGKIYLVITSQDVSLPSKLRSKKGVLWDSSELKELPSINFEVELKDKKTRLVSVVDLNDFNYEGSGSKVLTWRSGFILLTDLEIKDVSTYASNWIEKDTKAFLTFNCQAISFDLAKLNNSAILRYFPPDNGRHEMLALYGNEMYVSRIYKNSDSVFSSM
jgi:hypothetical protein